MRRMEQRDAFSPQRERDAHLLGDRVVPGGFDHGAEVLAERRQVSAIVRPAQDDELRVAIEPRELPQQVSDVGPDAEGVQLAAVDAYPHARIIQGGKGGILPYLSQPA